MISTEKVPLTSDQKRKLEEWMAQEGMDLLLRVVEAHAKEEGVLALRDATQTRAGKLEVGNAHLSKAQEWAKTAEQLRELRKGDALFYVKLS